MLCKHFASVFLHYQLSWNSLPAFYRDHPLLTIDECCVNIAGSLDVTENAVNWTAFCEEQESYQECSHEDSDDGNTTQLDVIRSSERFRDILEKMRQLSYLATSADILEEARDYLQVIYQRLLSACPSSDGLLLIKEQNQKEETALV